jgi:hypothetical protein
VFSGISQRCLKLSGEVKALIRGDEVAGGQVEVVVEPVPLLEQDRLEVGDELRVCDLRQSLLVHPDPCPSNSRTRTRFVMRRSWPFGSRPAPKSEVGTGVGTARAFPAFLARLTRATMRGSAWLRQSILPGLDSNQQPSG